MPSCMRPIRFLPAGRRPRVHPPVPTHDFTWVLFETLSTDELARVVFSSNPIPSSSCQGRQDVRSNLWFISLFPSSYSALLVALDACDSSSQLSPSPSAEGMRASMLLSYRSWKRACGCDLQVLLHIWSSGNRKEAQVGAHPHQIPRFTELICDYLGVKQFRNLIKRKRNQSDVKSV